MKLCISFIILFVFSFQTIAAERFIPKSDLIYKVLSIVNHLYVDSKRVKPNKMLEGALERLSVGIAPVLTKVDFKNDKVIINVSVDQFSREFEFKQPTNSSELNYILQQVVSFVKQYLEKDEKPENVDYAVINGFLRQLDPHSSLMIPEIYSDFSTQTSGNFGGVGMMISIRDGQLTIISPIDNTPASRVGLRADDRIVQINEESTINMSLSDAVKKLRGKAGTEVDIYFMRKGFSSPNKVTVIRDIIEITSVKSYTFKEEGKRVGLIKINTFQQNTIDEINSHLEKLDYDLKDFQGLIVDLRNNPGGLLDQAIKVSDRFLSGGVIVSTAGLNPGTIKSYNAHWFRSITNIPIIVLINNGSASASEIVTAAMKKNERAVVLGIQTFGKGSVQQVIPFPGGSALRLTTSKYLTPGNISIQSVGVSPHIAVIPYYVSNDLLHVTSPRLDSSEKSLDQNFAEWGDKMEPPEKTVYYLYKNDEDKDEGEDENKDIDHKELELKTVREDFLVQTAMKILLKNQRKDYNNLLKTALLSMDQEQELQEGELVKKFASFSTVVDWKSYKTKSKGTISSSSWVEIKTVSEDKEIWKKHTGIIPADNEIRLFLKAKNIGKTRISRLMAITDCENQLFDDRQFAFGRLDPGESKQWFVPIKISQSAPSRDDLITFNFTDQEKRNIKEYSTTYKIRQKDRPEFLYNISILEDGTHESKGNGDKNIQINETVTVKVDITNKGKGKSGSLTVLLKNGEGKKVFLKKGRQALETLLSAETTTAYFQFDLKKIPDDDDLDFSLDIIDSVFTHSSLNQKIKLPLHKKVAAINNMPPSINLSAAALTSSNKKYELEGIISDQKGVKDVYIFNNRKKIYYKNFLDKRLRKKVDFDLTIDLDKENNKIIIISRDDDNVMSQKNLFVRYSTYK